MTSYNVGMGKGLSEPCPPYRAVNVFGANLGAPDFTGWNCLPDVLTPTNYFDLSTITKFHEVVVVVVKVSDAESGRYKFTFDWYREPEHVLMYHGSWQSGEGERDWIYSWSYIGWTPPEISTNGDYSVEIQVSGAGYLTATKTFTVTGIPEEEPPPEIPPAPEPPEEPEPIEPPTDILSAIVEVLNGISEFFYNIYAEIFTWSFPFNLIAEPFYSISNLFGNIAWQFYYFSGWLYTIYNKITSFLSWDTIWSAIIERVPNLEEIRDWFTGWGGQVYGVVLSWWESTSSTVGAWIGAAVQVVQDGLDNLSGLVGQLQEDVEELVGNIPDVSEILTWFTSWIDNVVGVVNDWWDSRVQDVQDLIDSAIQNIAPMIEGWQEVRDQVVEFFTDPVEYIWSRFTDWFLGPEE